MRIIGTALLINLLVSAGAVSQQAGSDGYGFAYWVHGWRGRSPAGERVFRIQTNRYVADFNVESAQLTALGRLRSALSYEEALSAEDAEAEVIGGAELRLEVLVGQTHFRCIGADLSGLRDLDSPSRIIEAGGVMQRFDVSPLLFEEPGGGRLAGTGRFEVVAWPDRLHLALEVDVRESKAPGTVRMTLRVGEESLTGEAPMGAAAADGTALGIAFLIWSPDGVPGLLEADCEVAASNPATADSPLPVSYDERRGWFYVDLPENQFDMAQHPEHQDQFDLRLVNRGEKPTEIPLLLAFDGPFTGITGMTPLLTDRLGRPTGLRVQVSKNWHSKPEAPERYEGPWFHGFALVPLGPGEHWEGRLCIAYAHWGGVPAASHAQLCLVGWGVNQLWDQAAIGSWGETICYDPDINLNRSMIDDIRPLMVYGMGGSPDKPVLWHWTNNVGGGDFLVCFDASGKRLFPGGMRTAYLRPGPNLTETAYAGWVGDGAVSMRIAASTPGGEDVARALHCLRYDVHAPTPFSRLAFYQLGADHYNDHQFNTLARGNREGLSEEWTFERGGRVYERAGIPCEGEGPWWFSAHDAIPNAPQGGAWANRGLIVHSWKARLGGETWDRPFASFFGTENGVPSMNIELTPPPHLHQLEVGDYVEALLELVVLPMDAASYYGPNEALKADLEDNANTWKPVWRLAHRNDLQITVHQGELSRAYPIRARVDAAGELRFSVHGGLGHVPCTIIGLECPDKASLKRLESVHGDVADPCLQLNQCRQVDYSQRERRYEVTLLLPLDDPDDKTQTRHFLYSRD